MTRSATKTPYRIGHAPRPSKKDKFKGYLYVMLDNIDGTRPESSMAVNIRQSQEDLILWAYQNDYPLIENKHFFFDPSKSCSILQVNLTEDDFGPAELQEVPVAAATTNVQGADIKPIDANIQEALNSYSIFVVEHALALMKRYPMLSFEEARTIAISYEIQKSRR